MSRFRLGGSQTQAALAVQLPAPGPELETSASETQNRAQSGEALPFQLYPESCPAQRGGVSGARGGVLGVVRNGGKGWGVGLLRRLPVVLEALMRGTEAGVPTAVLTTTPLGNPV